MNGSVVRVCCGSAYVKGAARQYRYVVAKLFVPAPRKRDGVLTYRSTGIVTGPFRSEKKACAAARELAQQHNAVVLDGYGTLHNQRVPADLAAPLSKTEVMV